MQHIVHLATTVFWISVPLFGMVLILPWLRIDWLQDVLAVPVGISAAVLMLLTYSPDYVCRHSREGERFVYLVVFCFAVGTLVA
jgi:hypothetical protein